MKKYKIAVVAFFILSCIFACKTLFLGRIWSGVYCLAFLIFAVLFLIHLHKENYNSNKKSKLFAIGLVFGIIMLIISPFINGIITYRFAYAYKYYHMSNHLNHDVFPDTIPPNTKEIKFRILGEGISNRVIYSLSFEADKKTLTKLKQNAALSAYSISSGTVDDIIPKDVAPEFLKNEEISSCTVYRIIDEYGNECKIFISSDDTFICYFQE